MKNSKKALLAISGITLICLSACGPAKLDLEKNAPKYENDKQFLFFGYASPTDGKYTEDGIEYSTGEDYRTVERYKEYLDCGLNVMMIQQDFAYGDEPYETSDIKMSMDLCVGAGISKCIICDYRIYELSTREDQIIGEGCQFETQSDLNEYIASRLDIYSNHPVFYGVMLRDEPFWQHLKSYGAVYQAIKAYNKKDVYIESNLNPYSDSMDTRFRYVENYEGKTTEECYQEYLNNYLDYTKADKILMDAYPFRMRSGNHFMLTSYLKGLQIIAKTCKERKLKFEAVAQAMGGANNGNRTWPMMTVSSLEYQLNTYMSYGVDMIGYFTYWRKKTNVSKGEWFYDGETFVSQTGERTSLYYNAKMVHQEMQKFAPTILSYRYNASKTIITEPVDYPTDYAEIDDENFDGLDTSKINITQGRIALVNELKDPVNNRYMYSILNAMSPYLKEEGADLNMEYSIDFGDEYNAVMVFYRGEKTLHALNNGIYTAKLDAGYADYLIPYKA